MPARNPLTRRRFLGVAATGALGALLAACAPSAPPAPTEAPPKAQATDAQSAEPTAEVVSEGGAAPSVETVKVTTINVDMGAGSVFLEGEDMYNNMWTKAWKRDAHIEVETLWISTDYDTKLNLAIAAKELPEIFYCNYVQFEQLVAADMLQDLTEVYEQYASPRVRKMMEKDDPDVFATTHKDGKLLGLPRLHYGYECMTSFVWIKKNWMEEAGSPEVKTLEQFEALMKTFVEKHGSSYALPLCKDLQQFYFMAPTWHAVPRIWVEDTNGKIAYGSILPEMRDALAQWAEWYKTGMLRPDFATLDFDTMQADVLNGVVGLESGPQWYGWTNTDTYKNGGDGAWLEAYDLPSVDGQPAKYPIVFPNSVVNVVTKQCKHPEALVKLVNYYSWLLNEAVANGEKTPEEVLPFTVNNMHHIVGPFKVEFRAYDDTKEVVAAVTSGEKNPKFSSGYAYNYYNEIMKWYNDKDPTALGRVLQMGQERSSLNLAVKQIDNNLLIKSKLWGVTPQVLLDYGSTLDELLNQGFTKIIMNEEPVAYFDQLVQEWKAAGGDEATAAVEEMYGKK